MLFIVVWVRECVCVGVSVWEREMMERQCVCERHFVFVRVCRCKCVLNPESERQLVRVCGCGWVGCACVREREREREDNGLTSFFLLGLNFAWVENLQISDRRIKKDSPPLTKIDPSAIRRFRKFATRRRPIKSETGADFFRNPRPPKSSFRTTRRTFKKSFEEVKFIR